MGPFKISFINYYSPPSFSAKALKLFTCIASKVIVVFSVLLIGQLAFWDDV